MKIIEMPYDNLMNFIHTTLLSGEHKTAFCEVGSPMLIVHDEAQADKELCDKLGYKIQECWTNGGIICCSKGDFIAGHCGEHFCGWLDRFASYFVELFKAKGLNAVYEDNDILVDGYKVCGTSGVRFGRVDYTALFIGINTNLEDIKTICTKPMVKIPKGLSEYGITIDEIKLMFKEFHRQELLRDQQKVINNPV
jgi:hypothetical protein